jgi:hypothetical protein
MPLVGVSTLEVGAKSTVATPRMEPVDIAFAIDSFSATNDYDRTDSAGGDALTTLQTFIAARMAAEEPGRVRVGVVPYAGMVRLDTATFGGASWIDTNGTSALDAFNWDASTAADPANPPSRQDLFDKLDIDWQGCVEARPEPFDLSLTGLDPLNQVETLFAPAFMPDMADTDTLPSASHYGLDSYITDNSHTPGDSDYAGRARDYAKYDAPGFITGFAAETAYQYHGPNAPCMKQEPVLPASTDVIAIQSAIGAAMTPVIATGTNFSVVPSEGLMWAGRVVTAGAPAGVAPPRIGEGVTRRRVAIWIAANHNYWNAFNVYPLSAYNAYGSAAQERLSTGLSVASLIGDGTRALTSSQRTSVSQVLRAALDAKTLAACDALKADGIDLFVISWRFGNRSLSSGFPTAMDTEHRDLMARCAARADGAVRHFDATDPTSFKAALDAIWATLEGSRDERFYIRE